MNKKELDELSQRMNAEINIIREGVGCFTWTWTPVWPENAPTMMFFATSRKEAIHAYTVARRIWYDNAPHNGDY